MKKKLLILLASLFVLSGCQSANYDPFKNVESNNYTDTRKEGNIGEFDLISPHDGAILESVPTFSWSEASNAETYFIEICSHPDFISTVDTVTYYSQKNITTTSFTINSDLTEKDTTYYWRVFAVNKNKSIQSTSTFTFFMKAEEIEEFEFDLGSADDWTLHSTGSYADISIDNTNFFGNDKESLVVSFKQEDTSRGIPTSDGWIIVTKTVERTIYGTDSLFFNMYYAGQDSTIFIRLVDRDNEYWHCPVQISANAKQSIILKFSDFEQRTRDVTVANRTFDYERIKYMEIVFERTFGDGVFLLSNVKAIKYENYKHFFISKLDYTSYDENLWTYEAYNFEKVITQNELTIKYYNNKNEEHDKINGYGFAKLNVNRFFDTGDAIRLKVKYTGALGKNVILRIYEQDTDRWSYSIPFTSLPNDEEYKEFIIPYRAFVKSSIQADGRRQFYYVINIQFGLEGQYGTGSISFKDFEVIDSTPYKSPMRQVRSDGLIEDFEGYDYPAEMFLHYQMTDNNKDEYMTLNSQNRITSPGNNYAGQFEYKADMEAAGYGLIISAKGNFNALSLSMKDLSMKTGDSRFGWLTNWSPDVKIYIYLITGEQYYYPLNSLKRMWYEYTIPFSEFILENEDDLSGVPNEITVEGMILVGFKFQYFYKNSEGKHIPTYAQSNPVLVDNIRLTSASTFKEVEKERIVSMDGSKAMIENYETYSNNDDLFSFWSYGRDYEYCNLNLSNEVSSEGGVHSMEANYRMNSESVSYVITPAFNSDVTGKALLLSMKGDNLATVYINIYLKV